MKRLMLLLLLVSLGLNVGLGLSLRRVRDDAAQAVAACRFRDGDRPGEGMRGEGRGLHDERRFDPERHGRLLKLRERMQPRVDGLRDEVEAARTALREALRSPDLDRAAILPLVRAMTAAQARLDSTVAEALVEDLGSMTVEERREFLRLLPWERGPRPPR